KGACFMGQRYLLRSCAPLPRSVNLAGEETSRRQQSRQQRLCELANGGIAQDIDRGQLHAEFAVHGGEQFDHRQRIDHDLAKFLTWIEVVRRKAKHHPETRTKLQLKRLATLVRRQVTQCGYD